MHTTNQAIKRLRFEIQLPFSGRVYNVLVEYSAQNVDT